MIQAARGSEKLSAPQPYPANTEVPVRAVSTTIPSTSLNSDAARLPCKESPLSQRLLVFDCHEAWVYQLRLLDLPMDIVIGLRGRPKTDWDEAMRPLPPNARLLRPADIPDISGQYRCIVAHNLTDLLDVKSLSGPRVLVLHETLDGAILEQGATVPIDDVRKAVARFTEMTGTHVIAVSKLKARSWGLCDDIVTACAAPEDYPAWQGDLARRVAHRQPHPTATADFAMGIPQPSVWRSPRHFGGTQSRDVRSKGCDGLGWPKKYPQPSQILHPHGRSRFRGRIQHGHARGHGGRIAGAWQSAPNVTDYQWRKRLPLG